MKNWLVTCKDCGAEFSNIIWRKGIENQTCPQCKSKNLKFHTPKEE
jgi:predicted Zn-ribbon and HTH transcriptional regulator